MSTTTIYLFGQDGRISRCEEYANSHTATVLWDHLWKRYLAKYTLDPKVANRDFRTHTYYGEDGYEYFPMSSETRLKDFWALHCDPRLEWFERTVLRMTYDHMIVNRCDFDKLAEAMDLHTAKYVKADHRHVWHLPTWAELLRGLSGDESIRAAGWRQTSCGEDPFPAKYDEDGELVEEYSLDNDPKIWPLFFEVEAPK